MNAMVFVHQSLYKCNAKIIKRGGHVMAITPRHFLDFIQVYIYHSLKAVMLNVDSDPYKFVLLDSDPGSKKSAKIMGNSLKNEQKST